MLLRATTPRQAFLTVKAAAGHPRFWIIVALLTVYLVWGTTYLGIRFALESFPPYLMMGIRFVVAGSGLLAFLALRGSAMPTWKQWRSAIIVGALLLVGGMGSVAMAEQSVSSGLAAMLVSTAPVWTMLIGMFWGSRPSRREWIGVGLGLLGVALITLEGDLRANPTSLILILLAPVWWSLGSVLSSRLDMPKGAMGNAAEMLAGGIMLVTLGLVLGEHITTPVTSQAALALVYLITFGSLGAMTAYLYLLKTVKPSLATSYALVNPVIAMFLGVLLGGEHINPMLYVAMPLILIGIALVALNRSKAASQATVQAEGTA